MGIGTLQLTAHDKDTNVDGGMLLGCLSNRHSRNWRRVIIEETRSQAKVIRHREAAQRLLPVEKRKSSFGRRYQETRLS
jgi:hypothetical protein